MVRCDEEEDTSIGNVFESAQLVFVLEWHLDALYVCQLYKSYCLLKLVPLSHRVDLSLS